MTPELLKAVVTVGEANRLVLALDPLSDGLTAALGRFLPPGGRLVLEAVTDRTESAGGVTVTGTGTAEPFTGMTVTAEFTVVAGEVTAAIQSVGDQTWSFGGSFPRLAGTALDGLRFTAPVLSFAWDGTGEPAEAYLSFTGALQAGTDVMLLDLLLPTVGNGLVGRVRALPAEPEPGAGPERWPDVTLQGGSHNVDVGPLGVRDIEYRTTADPQAATMLAFPSFRPGLRMTGSVPVAMNGATRGIGISAGLLGLAEAALFGADFNDLGELELADVAGLLARELPVPFDFAVPGSVRLGEVRILLTPGADNPVSMLSATVKTQAEWPITDRLTIGEIDVTFRFEPPASPSVEVRGLIEIAGTASTLEVGADSATRSIGARLRSGDPPLPVRAVYQALTGHDGTHLPDLAVDRFESSVSLPSDATPLSVNSLLQLTGGWPVTEQIELEDVLFRVGHASASTTFQAGARFVIDDIAIRISAGYEAGKGWRFAGETGPGQQIPIGGLIESLSQRFGEVTIPAPLADLTVENLRLAFDTGTKDFAFAAEAGFPISEGQLADIVVTIDLKHTAGAYTCLFSGRITLGGLVFDLKFSQSGAASLFVATYRRTGEARTAGVRDLATALSADVAALVPADMEIDLEDAILAVSRDPDGTTALIGLDIGARLDLSGLSLVGQQLPAGETASIDDLRLLVATAGLRRDDVAAINALLPDPIAKLPVPAGTPDGEVVARGLSVSARLNLAGTPQALSMPVGAAARSGAGGNLPATPAAPIAVSTSDTAKWFTLQKQLGPLYLARVGVRYQDAVLWFLLDAALSGMGLTVSLDGLALGSPVDRFDPRFDLRGLGIDYRSPAAEIGGTFLRATVTDQHGRSYDEYDGAAVLKAKALTLSAIGSYAYLDGHPSLFIYAVLDYPIGGPSFFFVTGLAAGFGYNRSLIAPPVDRVAEFPLVAEAVAGAGSAPPATPGVPDNPARRVAAELAKLRSAVPPSVGDYFLAAGIRFRSFQMVDSFALLTVGFGQRVELNLLGLSTLVAPAPVPGEPVVPPLAEVQLALRASFLPDEGSLAVAAQLTPASYLLSRDCHLSGGFAFSCWFPVAGAEAPHAGDFVLTLGGYHPDFRVPAHYPRVPRLGLNWRVDDQLALKGECYFALTPSTLMAGIVVDATWDSGDLRVWLHAGADFLVGWKPYHYDAHAFASLQVTYRFEFFGTHEIRLDASADLHLWGPPFSGTARVSLSTVEFDITFGAGAPSAPQPIDWPQFKRSFLPPAGTAGATAPYCGVSLRDGLVRKVAPAASEDLGVVDPKRFVLVTDSVIPSTAADTGTPVDVDDLRLGPIGVAPMAVPAGAVTARQAIRIRRNSQPAETYFRFTPVLKRVPAALWGGSLAPSLNGAGFVDRALSGFEVRPKAGVEPVTGTTVSRDGWQYADAPVTPTFGWESRPTGQGEPVSAARIRDTIAADSTVDARTRLLAALGVTAPVDVDASVADAFTTG
jgi:uncharacterized protein DUF6603